jgi:hypothetical protein
MYRIMRVKSGSELTGEEREREETKARQIKWEEMQSAMKYLEKEHGWGEVDGTTAYTRDEDPSHKSMVLGEFQAARVWCSSKTRHWSLRESRY